MSDTDQPAPASEDAPPVAPALPEAPGRARQLRVRLRPVAPWVLLGLAVAVALASTVQWQRLAATESERGDVEAVAGAFMLALTTWDAADGMAATREELREAGTQRFAGEVDELFGTTEDLAGLEEVSARSEGDVRRTHVQEIDEDGALVLVVVGQRITADVVDGEEVSVRYAELDLVRTTDGRPGPLRSVSAWLGLTRPSDDWLVDDVELLVDVATQEAEPTPPGADLEGAP